MRTKTFLDIWGFLRYYQASSWVIVVMQRMAGTPWTHSSSRCKSDDNGLNQAYMEKISSIFLLAPCLDYWAEIWLSHIVRYWNSWNVI